MKLVLAALAALTAGLAGAQSAMAEQLPIRRIFESPDISGPRARGVALSPDGKAVTYIKTRADDLSVSDLWIAEVSGGEPRMLLDGKKLAPAAGHELSEAEKARRERAGVATHGVVDYSWDEQGRLILAPVEGDLWLYDLRAGQVRQLTRTPGDEIDAKVSPRGGYVSYVRADNLYVVPVGGGAERALTEGGGELQSWATAEFIAQEEMDRHTGYWWSPDDTAIALTHVDLSGVDVVPRPEVGATGARVVPERYPRTGRPNARVELYVQRLEGPRVKVDLGGDPDIYLARVAWSKDGKMLYVQRQSRDQRRLDLLAVDPATGKGRVILTETSPHWVDLTDDFKPLKDGTFLWTSERSGFRHIYLYRGDGRPIRQVTRGDWPVDAIEGVDERSRQVIFSAHHDSPIENRIYSVSYAEPGEPRALTPAGGSWNVTAAKTGGAFAGTYSDPKTPPQTALYRADGSRVRWIEENALRPGHPFWPYVERLRVPTFGTIKAADGEDLWWSMRTPPGFDPSKKYPVIVKVYGGPGSSMVGKSWANPEDQILLDAGFILFSLDNRGTPHRSVAFKTAIDRRLGQLEVDDQIAGARYLATLPYVDAKRIGVTGWSYGGYMTLLLLTAPDTPFAAGVAGAPVTDWKLYDTHYTERFMGTPADNPQGYAASDVLPRLERLAPDSLLIMHGMADDNVTFDHTTRVLFALQAAGTPFEMMVYPGLRHRGGWTPMNRMHRALMTVDFFRRKLGAP
jgi:dipeptidyl-peptidase-4